ncbi:hypothetical protein [Nesterenkonia populi]|uniref:hypothetical protein n=1 Tax=Nesterenkonia populi TaxID=1591087 RepID=UPI0011BDB935|nr:hypothetical protein [Nesterenkonia populi]
MISAAIEKGFFKLHLHDIEADDGGDPISVINVFEVGSIATYCEVLGLEDALDAVEVIVRKFKHERSAEGVDDDGHSPWMEVYRVKEHLEAIREDEAIRAQEEGTANDPRSPALRSAMRVRQELQSMSPDGYVDGSLLASCQQTLRAGLGLPAACDTKLSAVREARLGCEVNTTLADDPAAELSKQDREFLKQLIDPCLPWLQGIRGRFNHMLTRRVEDPLAPPPPPESDEPEQSPIDALKAKYGVISGVRT